MKISLIPWWVKALVLAAILAAASYFWYDKGYDARDLEIKTEQLIEIEELQAQKAAKEGELRDVSAALQESLANVRVEIVYIDKVVTKEIEKPVYSQCIVPESGVSLLRENAQKLNSTRKQP